MHQYQEVSIGQKRVEDICVPAQDNHGFVANAIIELQPKISENPTSGQ